MKFAAKLRRLRPRLKLSRWQIVCLLLATIPLGRLAWFVYLSDPARQISIGRETTYIDGPLANDGCVDYFAAVEQQCSDAVTVENNAVVLLWEAFGAKETTPQEWTRQFERLGAPVPATLNVDAIPLDLLVEASKRPKYYAPMIVAQTEGSRSPLYSVILPLTQAQRQGISQLLGRGGQRIAAGDIHGGWGDILACHRLARLTSQDPFVMNLMAGFGYEKSAIEAQQGLLSNDHLTAEQARSCLQDLQSLPSFPAVADKIDHFERLSMLDQVMVVARGGTLNEHDPEKNVTLAMRGAIDWNVILSEVNDYCDEIVAAAREPDVVAGVAKLQQIPDRGQQIETGRMAFGLQAFLFGRSQASHDFADIVIANVPSFYATALEHQTRCAVRQAAAQAAFAVVIHETEHGTMPDSLSTVVPAILPTVPIDPWSGKELVYRQTEKGFVIYSVGPNQRDDGGGATPFAGADDEDMDDVIFRVESE